MFIGLDLGTSGLRALLVDAAGRTIGDANANYSVSHPHSGWSEQDPVDWTDSCIAVMAALKASYPSDFAKVQGIGMSGHMHGATTLDAEGLVLRPCILWNDTRSHSQAARLDSNPVFRKVTGNIVFPGFTAPKLVWMAQHEPALFARIDKVLLPKDYMNFWLTGVAASDMSDSAGTAWLDVGARDWSDTLLDATGMRRDQMPMLYEGTEIIGTVKPDIAALLGLPEDVQVVAGGGDNAVAACGVGAMEDGDGFVSLGTSGVVLTARDGFAPMAETAVHSFCHAVPAQWYQMGVVLAATDSMNWLSGITGVTPSELTQALGTTPEPPNDLLFLPYLSGERTPHNDSAVRGGFLGLDIAHTRNDMTRAVMEGVCYALRDSLEALRATGAAPKRLLAIGGGTQSDHWVAMLASILDLPLDVPAQGEFGAALGAARLAICGVTGADPATIMTKPVLAQTVHPDPSLVEPYAQGYARYCKGYSAMKALQ